MDRSGHLISTAPRAHCEREEGGAGKRRVSFLPAPPPLPSGQAVFEELSEVFWSATRELRVTFVTPNVRQVSGYTAAEYLAEDPEARLSRVHAEDRPLVWASLAEVLRTGGPVEVEYRMRHREGRWVWIHSRMSLAHDATGAEFIRGILWDCTARRRLEGQLETAQRAEAIGQLAAGIAHDFRNVLAIVCANADLLAEELDGDQREMALEISSAASKGCAFTAGLLRLAHGEPSGLKKIDLHDLLRTVQPLLRRALGRIIAVELSLGAGASAIRAEDGEIEQVLMNLVVNARDAMPEGGRLWIRTELAHVVEDDGDLKPGRYVVLRVNDDGGGMTPETSSRIFDPFFTTKGPRGGTGLGLSTSLRIVRRRGGTIRVESAAGRGTTFSVYLARPTEG